jgi:cell division septation protein DedD
MRRSLPLALALLVAWGAAGCSRQESAWRGARDEDTTAAYERYLRDFPAGTHVGAAQARLDALREEESWRQASRVDEPEAYQRHLAIHPDGRRAAEARARLAEFLHTRSQHAPRPAPHEEAGATPVDDPTASSPAIGTATFRLQLGAFGDEQAARDAWQRLRVRHADLLGTLPARLDATGSGEATLWRLQAGPVDETAARALCGALESRETPCLVLPE